MALAASVDSGGEARVSLPQLDLPRGQTEEFRTARAYERFSGPDSIPHRDPWRCIELDGTAQTVIVEPGLGVSQHEVRVRVGILVAVPALGGMLAVLVAHPDGPMSLFSLLVAALRLIRTISPPSARTPGWPSPGAACASNSSTLSGRACSCRPLRRCSCC